MSRVKTWDGEKGTKQVDGRKLHYRMLLPHGCGCGLACLLAEDPQERKCYWQLIVIFEFCNVFLLIDRDS